LTLQCVFERWQIRHHWHDRGTSRSSAEGADGPCLGRYVRVVAVGGVGSRRTRRRVASPRHRWCRRGSWRAADGASGLPHPQCNNGDVDEPALVDFGAVRDWYAERGVPWGLRLPAGAVWPHGRKLFTKRLMGLTPPEFRAAAPVEGVAIRVATPADLPAVLTVDAVGFEESVELERLWLELLVAHPAVTVAIAQQDGEPVVTGHLTLSSGRAGPAAGRGRCSVVMAGRVRPRRGCCVVALAPRPRRRGIDLPRARIRRGRGPRHLPRRGPNTVVKISRGQQ
jgi:hypothetical protein